MGLTAVTVLAIGPVRLKAAALTESLCSGWVKVMETVCVLQLTVGLLGIRLGKIGCISCVVHCASQPVQVTFASVLKWMVRQEPVVVTVGGTLIPE